MATGNNPAIATFYRDKLVSLVILQYDGTLRFR